MTSLTNPQRRALAALVKRADWASAYGLGETRATLNALVERGLAIREERRGPWSFHANIDTYYRLTGGKDGA